jgi:hypothetical protein
VSEVAENSQKQDQPQPLSTTPVASSDKKKSKSALFQMDTSSGEQFSLAVGVWKAYMELYNNRVKPIPRTTAQVDFVPMAKAANVKSVEEAVDYFCRRFLRFDLQSDRRAAVIDFLKQELDSDTLDYDNEAVETALRRVVHLILSSPEYQLS